MGTAEEKSSKAGGACVGCAPSERGCGRALWYHTYAQNRTTCKCIFLTLEWFGF